MMLLHGSWIDAEGITYSVIGSESMEVDNTETEQQFTSLSQFEL